MRSAGCQVLPIYVRRAHRVRTGDRRWIRTSSNSCSTPFETVACRPTRRPTRSSIHPFQDAGGFAKVDLHRPMRCGFPEVVFGQGKTAAQIEAILKTLLEHEQGGLVTRLDPQAAAHLTTVFPRGSIMPSAERSGSAARATTGPSWAGS